MATADSPHADNQENSTVTTFETPFGEATLRVDDGSTEADAAVEDGLPPWDHLDREEKMVVLSHAVLDELETALVEGFPELSDDAPVGD